MWRNRSLLVLWGGEFASRVGESFFQIALLWYLVDRLGSDLAVGTITMFGYLPALVVGVWAGVLVDRLDYRRVMLVADACRAVLVLSLPGLYWAGWLPEAMVALLAFAVTSFSALFNPARDAIIPRLASGAELVAANSLVQTAWQFSLLVGPFLAAMLLPFLETIYLFAFVSLAFAASLATLLALRGGGRDIPPRPAGGVGRAALREFRQGLRALTADRRVLSLWVVTTLNNFFLMGPVIAGMPIYVKRHLGGSGSDFALIEGLYAGGMIVASWVLLRYGARLNPVRTLMIALVYDGLTYVPMLWLTTVPQTAALVVVHSLGIPAITVTRLTALQRMVRPEVRGRIFSWFHLAVSGMTALSIGAVGITLTWLPVNALFALIGVLCAATGVLGFCLPPLWPELFGRGQG